jgi:hypothetical protein
MTNPAFVEAAPAELVYAMPVTEARSLAAEVEALGGEIAPDNFRTVPGHVVSDPLPGRPVARLDAGSKSASARASLPRRTGPRRASTHCRDDDSAPAGPGHPTAASTWRAKPEPAAD